MVSRFNLESLHVSIKPQSSVGRHKLQANSNVTFANTPAYTQEMQEDRPMDRAGMKTPLLSRDELQIIFDIVSAGGGLKVARSSLKGRGRTTINKA